jgi:hypothetical protein
MEEVAVPGRTVPCPRQIWQGVAVCMRPPPGKVHGSIPVPQGHADSNQHHLTEAGAIVIAALITAAASLANPPAPQPPAPRPPVVIIHIPSAGIQRGLPPGS